MELEDLVHTLIDILSDFGTLKTFITTEDGNKLYNACEIRVSHTVDGKIFLKIEGGTSNEDR